MDKYLIPLPMNHAVTCVILAAMPAWLRETYEQKCKDTVAHECDGDEVYGDDNIVAFCEAIAQIAHAGEATIGEAVEVLQQFQHVRFAFLTDGEYRGLVEVASSYIDRAYPQAYTLIGHIPVDRGWFGEAEHALKCAVDECKVLGKVATNMGEIVDMGGWSTWCVPFENILPIGEYAPGADLGVRGQM